MRKTLKNYVLIIASIFLLNNNTAYATSCISECYQTFSMAADYLSGYYFYATASECTPISGSQSQIGVADSIAAAELVYSIINGTVTVGTSAITGATILATGLDLANDYWACLDRLQADYYRGLSAIGDSYDSCISNCDDYDDYESEWED